MPSNSKAKDRHAARLKSSGVHRMGEFEKILSSSLGNFAESNLRSILQRYNVPHIAGAERCDQDIWFPSTDLWPAWTQQKFNDHNACELASDQYKNARFVGADVKSIGVCSQSLGQPGDRLPGMILCIVQGFPGRVAIIPSRVFSSPGWIRKWSELAATCNALHRWTGVKPFTVRFCNLKAAIKSAVNAIINGTVYKNPDTQLEIPSKDFRCPSSPDQELRGRRPGPESSPTHKNAFESIVRFQEWLARGDQTVEVRECPCPPFGYDISVKIEVGGRVYWARVEAKVLEASKARQTGTVNLVLETGPRSAVHVNRLSDYILFENNRKWYLVATCTARRRVAECSDNVLRFEKKEQYNNAQALIKHMSDTLIKSREEAAEKFLNQSNHVTIEDVADYIDDSAEETLEATDETPEDDDEALEDDDDSLEAAGTSSNKASKPDASLPASKEAARTWLPNILNEITWARSVSSRADQGIVVHTSPLYHVDGDILVSPVKLHRGTNAIKADPHVYGLPRWFMSESPEKASTGKSIPVRLVDFRMKQSHNVLENYGKSQSASELTSPSILRQTVPMMYPDVYILSHLKSGSDDRRDSSQTFDLRSSDQTILGGQRSWRVENSSDYFVRSEGLDPEVQRLKLDVRIDIRTFLKGATAQNLDIVQLYNRLVQIAFDPNAKFTRSVTEMTQRAWTEKLRFAKTGV